MLPLVNNMAFSPMLINAPVTDGVLCIWNGLNGYDLRRLGNDLKPVNEKLEKSRYLKENPRKAPIMPTDTKKTAPKRSLWRKPSQQAPCPPIDPPMIARCVRVA